MPRSRLWDAIIVGGGPAGLTAALVLARCNREVLVCDAGKPRNRFARELHGFPTRDGIPPARFLQLARDSLRSYKQVKFRRQQVVHAKSSGDGTFSLKIAGGGVERCRKLLLATGIVDELPPLRGIERLYGASVFHCPYCDGWEWKDRRLAVYGRRQRAYEMCRALTAWSDDIALCTDGPSGLSPSQRKGLARNNIRIFEEPISHLSSRGRQLQEIVFKSGRALARAALFFDTPTHGRSSLARILGCQHRPDGGIHCKRYEATSVPGVYVAGNIIRDVQLVVVAAAEGAKAAFGINKALTREGFELKAGGRKNKGNRTSQT